MNILQRVINDIVCLRAFDLQNRVGVKTNKQNKATHKAKSQNEQKIRQWKARAKHHLTDIQTMRYYYVHHIANYIYP